MGFVQDGMTKEWPNGAAWLILKRLVKRYKPNDLMTEVELNRKLSELKMRNNENPGNLFTQIAAIRTWYSKDITEKKILPALIMALPQQYKWLATQYGLLQSKGTASNLDDLEEALVAFWWSSYSSGARSGKDDGEMGLASTPFEGTLL